jgi:uridine kinase
LSYFLDVVAPMHKKYVLPTRKNAEIIISNEYTPLVESKNSQIQENQLKFPINIEDKEHLSDIIYSF